MLRLIVGVGYLFSGALLFALPTLSRREYLFAVRVSQGFRSSFDAQRAVARFRFVVVVTVVAGLCAQLAAPLRSLAWVAPIASLATILITGRAFYWQHRRLKPKAVLAVLAREAELTGQPERLPWFAWLGIGPLLLIAAAAVFLTQGARSALVPVRVHVHGETGLPPEGGTSRSQLAVGHPV